MTIGQRIALKRKEYNLSQEALGELVGVSRQAIYKWESDQSLPEIEKLIALSQQFQVPVGWLLGVEEDERSQTSTEHFSETQLKTIEELLKHYVPNPSASNRTEHEKKARRRWIYLLVAIILIFLLLRVEQLKNQYTALENNLRNAIDHVNINLNSQLNSLTDRVETILKAQNDLTADYQVEILSQDLAANTITFRLSAVPKEYTGGMQATFLADSSGTLTSATGLFKSANQVFSCNLTCELTDDITISVSFIANGTTQTQVLEQYEGLWQASFPEVYLHGAILWGTPVSSDLEANMYENYLWVTPDETGMDNPDVSIAKIEVGLFRDKKLLYWATPIKQPATFNGGNGHEEFFQFPNLSFPVKEGELYCTAARITDNHGRTYMISDSLFAYDPAINEKELDWAKRQYSFFSSVDEWEF
ncbi:MAG: helix-turn-helix domain-containing protein [Lachnospiraceae bacterium]|nr:helix-turn-helix domain-containing protein [Lachnospiraceae bacterium]